jgi:hypothetical protein
MVSRSEALGCPGQHQSRWVPGSGWPGVPAGNIELEWRLRRSATGSAAGAHCPDNRLGWNFDKLVDESTGDSEAGLRLRSQQAGQAGTARENAVVRS